MEIKKYFLGLMILYALNAQAHIDREAALEPACQDAENALQSCPNANDTCRSEAIAMVQQEEIASSSCMAKQNFDREEMQQSMGDICLQQKSEMDIHHDVSLTLDKDDMQQILRSLVVLFDLDFHRKMFIIDVDFYKDEMYDIQTLLMRYMKDPEQSEMLFHRVAQEYVNEYGDACMISVLQGLTIENAELVAVTLMPYIKKAFVDQLFNALHRCIIFKCMKLKEMMDH